MNKNLLMTLATLASIGGISENNHFQSPFDVGNQEVQKDFQDLQKDNQRLEVAEAKRERKRLKRLALQSKQKVI